MGPHMANVRGAGVKSLGREVSVNVSSHDPVVSSSISGNDPAIMGVNRFNIWRNRLVSTWCNGCNLETILEV